MNKVKPKEMVVVAAETVALPISVLAKSWDPADTSINNNSDQPDYISPVAVQRAYNPMMGQHIHEGGGESRPMFTTSLKEY